MSIPAKTQMSEADRLAHELASFVRPPRTVLERFPAGSPRGQFPAEEFAAQRRAEGQQAQVVMDIRSDAFLVVVPAEEQA